MGKLADPAVVKFYDDGAKSGSDKRYPTTNIVRLELVYFNHQPGLMLDYACGLGANLIHMLECGHEVHGVDTSPHAIRRLQEKVDARPGLGERAHLQVIAPDADRLPFEDDCFDYLLSVSLLSLLSTRERISALLAEFRRVLKPGGRLVTDINGSESCFAALAEPLGDDYYIYRGNNREKDPIQTYCPDTPDKFAALVEPHFVVDEIGFTAHKFFGYVEQEFIICAHKPA